MRKLLLSLAALLFAGAAAAQIPSPIVTGPIPATVPPGDPSRD